MKTKAIRYFQTDRTLTRIVSPPLFVGFSESQKALIIEPNLTSVEQPTFEMGKVTAELLLEQIKNNSDETRPSKTIILDAKLNIRESSIKK